MIRDLALCLSYLGVNVAVVCLSLFCRKSALLHGVVIQQNLNFVYVCGVAGNLNSQMCGPL